MSFESNPLLVGITDGETLKKLKDQWAAQELRKRELLFCDFKPLKIQCATWNINGQILDDYSLPPWLNTEIDIFIIGFQELDLDPHAYLITDSLKEEAVCRLLEQSMIKNSHSMRRIASKKLVGLFMVVYIKEEHFQHVSEISTEYVTTGIMGMIGNKGAVGIRFKVFDSYLIFLNSHLAADPKMTFKRNQDFQEICKRMVFPIKEFKDYRAYHLSNPCVVGIKDCREYDFLLQYNNLVGNDPQNNDQFAYGANRLTTTIFDCDHLIWMGDLNYRISKSEKEVKDILENKNIPQLLKFDQVNIYFLI
jgi:phosphatidylinositol-bisphosphatase